MVPAGLPRAPGWAIGAQRAGAQAQARPERRRDVVQRSATVAAQVRRGGLCAQPLPTRLALRIDALHSPTRQVLHHFPPVFSRPALREKLPGFWRRANGVSSKKHTISSGPVANPFAPGCRRPPIVERRSLGLLATKDIRGHVECFAVLREAQIFLTGGNDDGFWQRIGRRGHNAAHDSGEKLAGAGVRKDPWRCVGAHSALRLRGLRSGRSRGRVDTVRSGDWRRVV